VTGGFDSPLRDSPFGRPSVVCRTAAPRSDEPPSALQFARTDKKIGAQKGPYVFWW